MCNSLSEQTITSPFGSLVTKESYRTISIGKYGSFQANHVLGRPFHLTFEILDKPEDDSQSSLRVIPTHELYAHIADEDTIDFGEEDVHSSMADAKGGVEYEVDGVDGKVIMRTNRETIDDIGTQKLTTEEIELLKQEETSSGKDIIAKILKSHSALEQKTAFALAKYTLRKAKKYMRRFTVMPLDVPLLTNWLLNEKEPGKIMEIREELLALISSWSNVHYGCVNQASPSADAVSKIGGGRWLVVDETGGLLVAALAERMGVLNCEESEPSMEDTMNGSGSHQGFNGDPIDRDAINGPPISTTPPRCIVQKHAMSAQTNTITMIHTNSQPNLSLLKYFDFDATTPSTFHPLYSHLKLLSWLQLLSPEEDTGYTEPEVFPDEVLQSWKGGKRGNYYRKRRRWERIKSVVDQTRDGGFDGLVIASFMKPATILHHAIPLLRGGAQVVVYSPNIETLSELADYYSTARRTAYLKDNSYADDFPNADFPLNPTLLLAPTIFTARCKNWQVLPGRTHPLMTGRGGAEGYIFTGTRVLPVEGRVEARGAFKRRKTAGEALAGPLNLKYDINADGDANDVPMQNGLEDAS